MISILCDSCGTRFQTPDETAGTTVACPKCQALNGVPAPVLTGPTSLKSGPALTEPERTLMRLRPAMFRARPFRFSVAFITAVGGIIGAVYFLVSTPNTTYAAICAAVSLLAVGSLAAWKVHNLGSSVEVTTKRTLAYRGFFGKYSNEVRHEDVRNIQISQTFLNRLLNVGNIDISSSGLEGIEITAKDIPGPYRLRDTIDAHRKM